MQEQEIDETDITRCQLTMNTDTGQFPAADPAVENHPIHERSPDVEPLTHNEPAPEWSRSDPPLDGVEEETFDDYPDSVPIECVKVFCGKEHHVLLREWTRSVFCLLFVGTVLAMNVAIAASFNFERMPWEFALNIFLYPMVRFYFPFKKRKKF